ncbi:hypothetical protein [Bradyrhizobium sp. Tv2a-2]|uniref:hypothetical protein n=1 Tax=Bradyrhizobium sp. Tv2a-2 TaxID=113395 RepID=UPI000465787D|nr:hypothetical protein [Bradyrhizobium sp. Tv2a-2]
MTKFEDDEVLKHLANVPRRKEDKGAFWMGVAFIIFALCFPAYQALIWLQSGNWWPLPISHGIEFLGWHVPVTQWVGAQKIIDWLFDLPLWSIPAFMAFGCFSAWKETV